MAAAPNSNSRRSQGAENPGIIHNIPLVVAVCTRPFLQTIPSPVPRPHIIWERVLLGGGVYWNLLLCNKCACFKPSQANIVVIPAGLSVKIITSIMNCIRCHCCWSSDLLEVDISSFTRPTNKTMNKQANPASAYISCTYTRLTCTLIC